MIAGEVEPLFEQAWLARSAAYAPYSGFRVGAALLTTGGAVFHGCNVENISFGLTICAERVAAVAAVQAGATSWAALALAAETDEPIVPCGACRQFLAEFQPDLVVHSETPSGKRLCRTLSDLLPFSSQGILNR